MDQISIYLPGILLAYSAFLLAIASPGPNFIAVLGTSISAGRRSGILLAFGIAIGSLTWSTLTVLGLSALLASYAYALTVIKLAGGLYLLWLAYKSYRAALSQQDIDPAALNFEKQSRFGYVLRGYTVQMTNPKAALAWIAIVSLGLQQQAPFWVGLAIVLGTFFLSIAIHFLYAIAFSSAPMIKLYSKARRSIQFALGSFFAFAGVKLLISRS